MSKPDLRRELERAPAEPLLPIEKKLIGWSLAIGLILLAVGLPLRIICCELPRRAPNTSDLMVAALGSPTC